MITEMQAACLELKSQGMKIKDISRELHISVRTVEFHLSEARERLSAKDTTHAVVLALKKGLINFMICVFTINAIQINYKEPVRRPTRASTRAVRTTRAGTPARMVMRCVASLPLPEA